MKNLQCTIYNVREKSSGFTLLEVLIAMGIAAIIGGLLLVIIVNSTGLFLKQQSKVSEGININDVLPKVRSSIKIATSVINQYTGGSTTYTSGATQLILKIASVDLSNNIIEGKYDYYIYYLDGNFMRFKLFPDAVSSRGSQDQILSNSVQNLSFLYYNLANPPAEVLPADAAKVKITLTLRQKTGAGLETTTQTAEANLRND